jgi:hypothetical protein
MADTTRSFNNMLNEYITNDLVSEALLKRDWFVMNVPKDNGWKGGTMPVPFQGTYATSIKMGSLTAETDVAKDKYVRGTVTAYKEAWGTLRFEHGDLIDHDGAVNEKSFLKILPRQINEFGDRMKEQMSKVLLTGPVAFKATNTGTSGGVVQVDRVERASLDQKFELDMGAANQVVYVTAINLNTNELTLSATRGGAALDLTGLAVPVVAGNSFYYDGVLVAGVVTNTFTNLRESLLSAANGGSATLYGQSKVAYPYLQAINLSAASVGLVSVATVKLGLFNAYNEIRKKARGNANTILMSFKHLGSLMASLEDQKGAFKVTARDEKASLYGWTEITITSVRGTLKVVGIQEMDDDVIIFLDMEAVMYYSNGELIRKRVAPDGKQYYEQRSTSGYFYLLDMAALGELVLHAPTKCGIIYGISY